MRDVCRVLVYPVAMIAAVSAACALADRGVDGGVTVAIVAAASGPIVLLLERLIPFRTAWNQSRGDVRVDLLHFVSSGLGSEVGRIAALAVATVAATTLAARTTPRWPAHWPIALQLALALPVAELGLYWLHRLSHRGGWLWRVHSIHHSAPRLYALNSARNHPLDSLLGTFVSTAPLVALGAPARLLVAAFAYWTVHAFLQHSNVDVRLGPLNWVFSMAEVHRWHHARTIEEANANYGQTVVVWDLVFRTRRVPTSAPPTSVGLPGLDRFPRAWIGQLAAPFDRSLWRGDG